MVDNLFRLQTIVGKQLGIDPNRIKPSANFREDLGADSLDIIELFMTMEKEFKVKIKDPTLNRIETVQDALQYIERYSNKI